MKLNKLKKLGSFLARGLPAVVLLFSYAAGANCRVKNSIEPGHDASLILKVLLEKNCDVRRNFELSEVNYHLREVNGCDTMTDELRVFYCRSTVVLEQISFTLDRQVVAVPLLEKSVKRLEAYSSKKEVSQLAIEKFAKLISDEFDSSR